MKMDAGKALSFVCALPAFVLYLDRQSKHCGDTISIVGQDKIDLHIICR
jgi:hypothetical protein